MDTPTLESGKRLSLFEIQRAIETISTSQAMMGIAVVALLKKYKDSEPDDDGAQMLIEALDRSISELRSLAFSVIDIPNDT